ncbi:MAG: ABC transporter substrate-binding protein [Gammaproteobacteria bacterium BRH_c0]|nr:MAG: ABC transporter substrate-binding protein [Gammaproteobacteria bacterium BRH_c0]
MKSPNLFTRSIRTVRHAVAATAAALTLSLSTTALAEPLKIGYSDWPGWVAWEVGIEKGWFDEAGVEVQFEWFDYVASMVAFSSGQLDAVAVTNGDALVTGATGGKNVMILANDYSNGNDMIIGVPGITSVADLKGKKVGVEIGFVSHLLLLNALEKAGLTEADVELVNVPTNETPQVLASGAVSAIVAWQPSSGQALDLVPGSTAIYTSTDEPGLIYDVLAVSPQSLSANKAEWEKVAKVWYRIVDYIQDPATQGDAVTIMAARVGLSAEEYMPFLQGTKILTLAEAKPLFSKADGFASLYGSSKIADDFNVKYEVYKESQDIDSYIDGSITLGLE